MEIILVLVLAGVAAWWWMTRNKNEIDTIVAPHKGETLKVEEVTLGSEAVVVVPNAVVPSAILEQAPAVEQAPKKPARKTATTKDNRDIDKDGVVSSEEKAVWVGKLDLNKDGVVDASEKKVAKTRAKPVAKKAVPAKKATVSKKV